MKDVAGGFLVGVVMMLAVWAGVEAGKHTGMPSPAALPSPSPAPSTPPVPSVFVVPAPPGPKPTSPAIERCETGGGIPVMGFEWHVVCVKPEALDWWDGPERSVKDKKP